MPTRAAPTNRNRQFLTMPQMQAMEMHFEGYTLKEVAQKLYEDHGDSAPKYGTLRSWFAEGGMLFEIYEDYAKKEAEQRKQHAEKILRAHLHDAVRELVMIMTKGKTEFARLTAANQLIERQLGKPMQKVQVEPTNPMQEIFDNLGLYDDEPEISDPEDGAQLEGAD